MDKAPIPAGIYEFYDAPSETVVLEISTDPTLTDFVLARLSERIASCGPDWRLRGECEAWREIVQSLAGASLFARLNPSLPTLAVEWLHTLAYAYSDHPDYRREWRP